MWEWRKDLLARLFYNIIKQHCCGRIMKCRLECSMLPVWGHGHKKRHSPTPLSMCELCSSALAGAEVKREPLWPCSVPACNFISMPRATATTTTATTAASQQQFDTHLPLATPGQDPLPSQQPSPFHPNGDCLV